MLVAVEVGVAAVVVGAVVVVVIGMAVVIFEVLTGLVEANVEVVRLVGLAVVVDVEAELVDEQGYWKPQKVHVPRFWSSWLGIARVAVARARKVVLVRSFR